MNIEKNGTEPQKPVTRGTDPVEWVEVGQLVSRRLDGSAEIQKQLANGLTKREFFAALALQGLLATPGPTVTLMQGIQNGDVISSEQILSAYSSRAVEYADELMKQLNK